VELEGMGGLLMSYEHDMWVMERLRVIWEELQSLNGRIGSLEKQALPSRPMSLPPSTEGWEKIDVQSFQDYMSQRMEKK
jgi:hypothetical protein